MDVLNFLSATSIADPSGLWEWLILSVFNFIANYGTRVVVFTLILKLILSPLDIYQRVMMKKNQRITEQLKPEIDKIKKTYAGNPQVAQQKQMELNKKHGYNMLAGCLPMLVTLVISIYLLTGLNNISQYKNMQEYVQMYDQYNNTFVTEIEKDDYFTASTDADGIVSVTFNAIDYIQTEGKSQAEANAYEYEVWSSAEQLAQESVVELYYQELQESFLWVKNVWSPDVPWESPIKDYSDFMKAVSSYGTDAGKLGVTEAKLEDLVGQYETITALLYTDEGNAVNGYLILPIMSILVMLGSTLLTQRAQTRSGQVNPMGGGKMMMFIMPVMFGVFAMFYTAAFSLYIIASSSMTILMSLASTMVMVVLDKIEHKKTTTDEGVVRYGRPDPNANNDDNNKK